MSASFLYMVQILQSTPFLLPSEKRLKHLGCGMELGLRRKRPQTLDVGRMYEPRAKGDKGLQSNLALCTHGPATSPNTFDSDSFTQQAPFSTGRVMNQLSPLQNWGRGEMRFCEYVYVFLMSSSELTRRQWGSNPNHQQELHQRALIGLPHLQSSTEVAGQVGRGIEGSEE